MVAMGVVIPVLPVLLLLLLPDGYDQQAPGCNCFDCKDIIEGPYAGSYYAMGSVSLTGGCLYR